VAIQRRVHVRIQACRSFRNALPVRKLAVAFLTAPLVAVCALSASAGALADVSSIPWGSCGENNEFACGHLTVPLDPSGATPGTITLALRRHRAPVGEARSAVIALAGGPGQAAIPFAEAFTELLGPILTTRDLIVFDQRGTGNSHPLSCHGFEHPFSYHSFTGLIAVCAEQIGPERAFYTTPDSVADIEAIRRAGGYEKLVLYGTSYGTKVAEEYAQEYPQHVEALILDSVVPPTGPDPLDRSTFEAVPRILRQLCAYHQCSDITHNPVGDLARLVRRMSGGPLRGRVIGDHGHPHTVFISSNELLDVLLDGDFDPILRAEFPTAVRAAATGDTAPLARLLTRAAGGEGEEGEGIDAPLYYATTCEEEDFPWSRTASPRERLAQASAQIGALPRSSLAPFTPANVLDFDELRTCAFWPFATPAPPAVPTTMPDVPTLILSGADDLRTPTANARALAAQIPGAHLLVVPNTGHSVLTTEPTHCARNALLAMFAGGVGEVGGNPILPCPSGPPVSFLRPTPLPPARLADVPPARGYHGRAGRTLRAVELTLADFSHQLSLQLLETAGGAGGLSSLSSLSSGGLRAGWAQLTKRGLRFHGYAYVPGVTLSGTVKAESVVLRIGGSAATHGTLRLGARKALVGTLGTQRVHLPPGPTSTAAIVDADAQASPDLGLGGSAARAAVRELARDLGWLPWL
jgi:pimeloyl-ACP methyl ester carboxylesterase